MANVNRPGGPKNENLGSTMSSFGSEVKEKSQEAASTLTEKGKELASSVSGTAQDLTRRAGEIASNVGQRAEDTLTGVGGRMQHLAGTIRERAPHEGMVGSAASTLASGLEAGGRYLQEEQFTHILDDVTGMIRRYPFQALLVGFGIGFLLGRSNRS